MKTRAGNKFYLSEKSFFPKGMLLRRILRRKFLRGRKKGKILPSFFDRSVYSAKQLVQKNRHSQRILALKRSIPCSSSSPPPLCGSDSILFPDSTKPLFDSHIISKRTRVGPLYQAVVPECSAMPSETNSKWLGWKMPLWLNIRGDNRVGKGRNDHCGCANPNSDNCILSHVKYENEKLHFELGSTFFLWGFEKMGERVSNSWSESEEEMFEAIVRSNPMSSSDCCFWDHLMGVFPYKSRVCLLSYYYNVFLLRNRRNQNRNDDESCVNTDDEFEQLWSSPDKSVKKNADFKTVIGNM